MARMSLLSMPIPKATVATTILSLPDMKEFWTDFLLAPESPAWYGSEVQLNFDFPEMVPLACICVLKKSQSVISPLSETP